MPLRILLTGASSFTGLWFARALVRLGHEVVMTLTRPVSAYTGVRAARVKALTELGRVVPSCRFGTPEFADLIALNKHWDVLCHHAADVTDYKSAAFDIWGAVQNNTRSLPAVFESLWAHGCRRVVLTGSVFEGGEGAGSEGLPAFSPYGLSKQLTAEIVRYYAGRFGLTYGKFVIPNPFGPLEEPRFTSYLVRCWRANQTASVRTPDYVRDNIHVVLLARAYAQFVETLPAGGGPQRLGPCGYIESQGAFALRFAREMRARLELPCEVELCPQVEFSEPRVRVNTDPPDARALGFDEREAWDAVADYYRRAPLS